MKKLLLIQLLLVLLIPAIAQQPDTDTIVHGNITVIRDGRLDELAKKETAFNEALALLPRAGKGYRLVILSTNDRPMAMQVRAQLLQRYPDQKVYMSFQPPYIKLKFGNYVEKADAENMRKDIQKNKIVSGNIYVIPDTIEIKPDKNKDKEAE